MTSSAKKLQIFRAGSHTAMSGDTITFSEADVAASINAYDPAKHEAPIVVGHPKADLPAYGWVQSLELAEGGVVLALPKQVDPAFAELVEKGSYKKISAAFYPPNHPGNPVQGVYYLRHVGFLGAQPPAVKGLKSAEFSADEADLVVLEFGDWTDGTIGRALRGLREWIIGKFGLEEADRALPSWTADALIEAALTPDSPPQSVPGFSEHPQEPPTMTKEQQDQQAELDARQAELDAQAASFAERENALKQKETATRHAANVSFAEQLADDGKVLATQVPGLVAFMDAMPETAAVEFSEGETAVNTPAGEWLRKFLTQLPEVVHFGEHGAGNAARGDLADPADLAAQAIQFVEAEAKKGRVISVAQAITEITNKAGE